MGPWCPVTCEPNDNEDVHTTGLNLDLLVPFSRHRSNTSSRNDSNIFLLLLEKIEYYSSLDLFTQLVHLIGGGGALGGLLIRGEDNGDIIPRQGIVARGAIIIY